MIEPFVGHKPHVAPPEETLERVVEPVDNVANSAREWDYKDKRYFVWADGITGRSFVYSGLYDAMIAGESFVPKSGVLFKVELKSDDRRCLGELMADYPWPVTVVEKTVLVAVSIPVPAMFGGMNDSQG